MELGYEAPPVETINSDLRYASLFYAKPDQRITVLKIDDFVIILNALLELEPIFPVIFFHIVDELK